MKISDSIDKIRSLLWFINAMWYSIRSSYWFLPAIMVLFSVFLSFVMIYIDYRIIGTEWIKSFEWFTVNTPDGARALLSTVAGSMITVAGVVFSILIVALTLASSQFGPRLLENFMLDRGNQVVLGTFIATFVYCLLLLRTIRGGDSSFIPQLSVTVALLLAIFSISVLIYFIDHAARSIRASSVINGAKRNLDKAIEDLFPEKIGHGRKKLGSWWIAPEGLPTGFSEQSKPVKASSSGYLRVVDNHGLMSVSTARGIILKIEHKPGDFVVKGMPLAYIWPGGELDDDIQSDVEGCFLLGSKRTSEQDAEYAIDQLVEIAVRALSPGLNDPFTAVMCIDYLTSALCVVAGRSIPSAYRYDERNQLRVIAKATTFSHLLDASFNQIRQYGQNSVAVTIRLLEGLIVIASYVSREEDESSILRHGEMIKRGSEHGITEELDRRDVGEKYRQLTALITMRTPSTADRAN